MSSIQDPKTFPAESFSDPLSLTATSNEPQSKTAESAIPSKDPLAAHKELNKDTRDVTVAEAHLVKEKVEGSDVYIIDCGYIYIDFWFYSQTSKNCQRKCSYLLDLKFQSF